MKTNGKKPYLLLVLLVVVVLAGIVGFRHSRRTPQPETSLTPPEAIERQPLPSPSALTLPPLAPLPPHPAPQKFPRRKPRPGPAENQPAPKRPAASPSPSSSPKPPPPSKWQIIKQFNQVISLDDKYYQIAIESDRYGYKEQAIRYYKKYLFVAPTGPHAQEVRSRLSQLENAF